jgi:uncharacterized membrane protein
MKKIIATAFLFAITAPVYACPFCNPEIRKDIFNSSFYPNLLSMLSAFIVLALAVLLLWIIATRRYKNNRSRHPASQLFSPVPLTTTAIILGIGIGGFIDGILLHQILQWHEMLSNQIPPDNYVNKSVNMFWDGIFHAFTLLVTFAGIILLWKMLWRRDIDRSGHLLAGGLLMGWGLFNVIEGVIDHHLLKLHNVKEITLNKDLWNNGFLAASLLLIVTGWLLVNKRRRPEHY